MSLQRRLLNVAAILAAATLAIGIAACGSSDDTSSDERSAAGSGASSSAGVEETPAFKKVLAAAREEGALNLNWGFSTPDARPLIEAFEKRYPGIKITHTPNHDQPANASKLFEEAKAGKPSSTDAFVAVPQLLYTAGPRGADVLEKVDWESFAPWTKGLATSDGVGLSIFDQYPTFVYNTSQFTEEELPNTAADVLKLKQPIASTPYAAQFNVLGASDAMGEQGLKDYVTAFKPAGFIGCGDLSRVASGEFAALWVGCGANVTEIFAATGAPLKNEVIQDVAVSYPWYGGVPKNSAHPNAAKVWIAWLNTPEAQKLLFEVEFADNRRIKGSQTAKQLTDYEAKGVKFTTADYDFVAANQNIYSREFHHELIGWLTKK